MRVKGIFFSGIVVLIVIFLSLIYFMVYQNGSTPEAAVDWRGLSQSELMDSTHYSRIFFFDKQNGIALSPGAIARSNDGGENWTNVANEQGSNEVGYYSLFFNMQQTGWVVGARKNKPILLETADKGKNWNEVKFDEKSSIELNSKFSSFLDVCFDKSGHGWIVGKGGILEAVPSIQNWKVANIFPTEETLYSVACTDSGEIWAAGQDSVFHFRQGWKRKTLREQYIFGRIISSGSSLWLLGAKGRSPEGRSKGILLRSLDGGETWQDKTPKAAGLFHDLALSDGKGWLIGEEGSIFHSSDHGSSWTKSRSPTTKDLLDIFLLDPNHGWAVGANGTILRFVR